LVRICNGSGASSVAYTMLKMAVFGPMPRANARTAAAESPGAPISPRTANLKSDHSIAIPQKHKRILLPDDRDHLAAVLVAEGRRIEVPGSA
jgi:hypothetical protein